MSLTRRQFLFGPARRPEAVGAPASPAPPAATASALPGLVAAGSTFSLEAFYATRAATGADKEPPPIAGPTRKRTR